MPVHLWKLITGLVSLASWLVCHIELCTGSSPKSLLLQVKAVSFLLGFSLRLTGLTGNLMVASPYVRLAWVVALHAALHMVSQDLSLLPRCSHDSFDTLHVTWRSLFLVLLYLSDSSAPYIDYVRSGWCMLLHNCRCFPFLWSRFRFHSNKITRFKRG